MLITDLIEAKLSSIINQIDSLKSKNINFNCQLNKHPQQIIYQSPVCLILGQINHINALLLAQKISHLFNQDNHHKDLIAVVSDQGWLEFIVSDQLIEQYLNTLAQHPFIIQAKLKTSSIQQPISFIDYYLHARSCSLLTSAHQQQIIMINNLEFPLNKWQIIIPETIKYSLLYNQQVQEIEIIKQILIITDKNHQNKLLIKPTLNLLKKLFFQLESRTMIGGDTLIHHRQISQARLGLIALILHYYQNIFDCQYQQTLPLQI